MTDNGRTLIYALATVALTAVLAFALLGWGNRYRESNHGRDLPLAERGESAQAAAAASEPAPGAASASIPSGPYATCAACHGAQGEGNPALNAPRIAGQEAWYLKRQLEHFRSGVRGADPADTFGQQMRPMAAMLDDAKLDQVVRQIVDFPVEPSHSPTLDGDPERGKPFYATCVACHGDRGQGNPSLNAPRIGGQEDWYLYRQLVAFRDGLRGSDPADTFGAQMKPMVSIVNGGDDQSLKDLAMYVSGLGKEK